MKPIDLSFRSSDGLLLLNGFSISEILIIASFNSVSEAYTGAIENPDMSFIISISS